MRKASNFFTVVLLFLFVGSPSGLRAELIGYWPFDGNGRGEFMAATPHGEIDSARDRFGREGGAVSFDALKKAFFSISLNSGTGFDQLKTATFSIWVRWDDGLQTGSRAFGMFAPVLSRQQNGSFSTHLLGLTGNDPEEAGICWRSELKCESILRQEDSKPVGAGEWHHVAIAYRPNGQTLYVDGKAVARSDTSPGISNRGAEPPLVVGGWSGDGNLWSTASVDDLAIWNEELSPEQIASLAASKITPLEVRSVIRFEDAADYSSLNEVHTPREHITRSPLQAIKFARDTLALVERTAPRAKFRARLNELERQLRATLETHEAKKVDKAIVVESTIENRRAFAELTAAILELRRQIIFSHPALDFDRLLINKRPAPLYLHQSRQYLGRYSPEGISTPRSITQFFSRARRLTVT